MMEEQYWSSVYTLVLYLLITGYCTKCEIEVEYLYSKYGESVTLKCLNSSNTTTWIGPITNELNESLYAADGKIAENLPNAGNVELTGNFSIGEFNLRIISLTEKEDGLYKCQALQNNQPIELRFYLIIKEPPTNLLINEGMNIITGNAGTDMNIKCTVSTGVPKHETQINMYRNTEIIKNDTAEMLSHTFKPQINNDKDHFTCVVENPLLELPLRKSAVLNITCKPFFVSQNEQRQYGIIGSHLDISVYVYSYPKYTEVFAISNGENISLKNKEIMEYTSPVWTYIKGVKVRLAGYKIVMSRNQLQPNHLTNYSFLVINEIGQQEFDVEVVSVNPQMQNDVTDEAIIISVITTAMIALGVIVFLIKEKLRKRRQKTNSR